MKDDSKKTQPAEKDEQGAATEAPADTGKAEQKPDGRDTSKIERFTPTVN